MRNSEGTFRHSILQGNCASTLAICFLKVKTDIWIKQLKTYLDQCLNITCDLLDRLSWKRPNVLFTATALTPAHLFIYLIFVYIYCSNTLLHIFAVLLGLSLLKISDPSLSGVQYKYWSSQKGIFVPNQKK